MGYPIEIIFCDIDRSEALAADIQAKSEELGDLYSHIMRCRVVVEALLRRGQIGKLFGISIQLSVPRRDLIVGRAPHDKHQHTDPRIATEEAFDAMRGKLKDYVHEQRGDTIQQSESSHGLVAKICRPEGADYPEQGYGFISTCDGREIYFHANSLQDTVFQRLELGSEVNFIEELGNDGPHAASVRPVGHEHHHLVE